MAKETGEQFMARVRAEGDAANEMHRKTATHMVEATDFEAITLWKEWHHAPTFMRKPLRWEAISLGFWQEVGKLAGFPVCVTVSFAKVEGALVAFYDATSRVVDHDMVKDWGPPTSRRGWAWENAHTFNNPVLDIERRTGKP